MPTEAVFTFANTHDAIAGEKALVAAGVGVRVMPRPSALGDGCGICLRVDGEQRAAAAAILREASAPAEAAYLRIRRGGKSEYRSFG